MCRVGNKFHFSNYFKLKEKHIIFSHAYFFCKSLLYGMESTTLGLEGILQLFEILKCTLYYISALSHSHVTKFKYLC
jgi:hypothetical protein